MADEKRPSSGASEGKSVGGSPLAGHAKQQEGDRPLGGQSTTDKENQERGGKQQGEEQKREGKKQIDKDAAFRAPGESMADQSPHPEAEIPPPPPPPNPAAPQKNQEPIGERGAAHHETPRDKKRE